MFMEFLAIVTLPAVTVAVASVDAVVAGVATLVVNALKTNRGQGMHAYNCDCDHCSARKNAANKAYNKEYNRNHPPGTDKHEEAMKKSREVLSRDPSEFDFNR